METKDNNLQTLLSEARGISAKVTDARVKVCTEFQRQYGKFRKGAAYNSIGVKYVHGGFSIKMFDTQIPITWQVYDYKDNNVFAMSDTGGTGGQLLHNQDNTYSLTFWTDCIAGEIDMGKVAEVIQHELSHYWEKLNYGKFYQGMNRYEDATGSLMGSSNKYMRYIGNIFYMYKRFEDRAYGNGAYAFLMSCNDRENVKLNIQRTELYGAKVTLEKELAELKGLGREGSKNNADARTAFSYIKVKYNMSYRNLIKLGERTISYLDYVIGRTMRQVEDDIAKEKMERSVFYPFKNMFNKFKR